MTLQAYIDWNTLNLGRSAAIAYLLLILVIDRRDGLRQLRPAARDGARMTRIRSGAARADDLSPPAKLGAFLLLLCSGRSSSCSRSTGSS